MSDIIPVRGRIYRADVGYGLKPWLVVSNNARNRVLDESLVVRITTTRRELPGWVQLGPNDPLVGYVNCDDLGPLYRDQITEDLGALSNAAMVKVGQALRHVLAI
ncbi:type II toxin-antitoxin system PemK/MazF family toxin [Streptomyces sp. H27-G5]|uniref:type II toxin-antitoxin system PemK/MazF family toxin n=1 Tax=Streptomyces sp. H27-G5 TaxID=2996698 RepID=UPI0022701D99|nr:type II toxin-antitoxin system PemK/MazF family toxin [Streptomyces sp. H27-G5]MCY0924408.1 type II toxin-antitoxin system PemK/MazF family toxin [Streptomyces sp. H27-G5]